MIAKGHSPSSLPEMSAWARRTDGCAESVPPCGDWPAHGMTAERPAAYTAKDCGVPLRAERTAHRKKKETHVAQVTASFGGKSVLHRGRLAEDKLSPAAAESAAAARAAGWM